MITPAGARLIVLNARLSGFNSFDKVGFFAVSRPSGGGSFKDLGDEPLTIFNSKRCEVGADKAQFCRGFHGACKDEKEYTLGLASDDCAELVTQHLKSILTENALEYPACALLAQEDQNTNPGSNGVIWKDKITQECKKEMGLPCSGVAFDGQGEGCSWIEQEMIVRLPWTLATEDEVGVEIVGACWTPYCKLEIRFLPSPLLSTIR